MTVVWYQLPRPEAQRAVSPARLHDVLLSLRRAGVVSRFRVYRHAVLLASSVPLEHIPWAGSDAIAAKRFTPRKRSKLTAQQVQEIRGRQSGGESVKSLAITFSVSEAAISRVCARASWRQT